MTESVPYSPLNVAGNIAAVPKYQGPHRKSQGLFSRNCVADQEAAVRQTFADNLRDAFLDLLRREGRERMSREELGERVAKALGRKAPLDQSTVRGWFQGSIPPAATGMALARVLNTTFGALLGESAEAPQSREDAPETAETFRPAKDPSKVPAHRPTTLDRAAKRRRGNS